ncbi:MAG: T9SS type A sorting domain-containing protein [Cyclobacteriaceae bacterium]|nr:T9SS type A sorting domain-containing protein [Cyclobacteriaceae bacterium]UYN85232.1 MAG: T9SS type A sorting domain-containing protein [Cyclobacteriaceae bacterium]
MALQSTSRIIFKVIFLAAFFSGFFFFEVTAQTTYYARPGGNGNWNNPDTWTTVNCASTIAATTVPGPNDHVIICAGRTVTYNSANTTISNLTIELTGVLTISGGNNITLNSLVLDGTVNGTGGGDLRIGRTAGQTLSGIGSFSVANTNAHLRIQNNVTILVGTDLKFNSTGQFNLNRRTATNNGRISILSSSNFIRGTFINNSSTAYLLYTPPANWPNNVVLTATATGNTVEFGSATGGPWNMNTQSSYHHLIISGAAVKRINAATTTIRGNLTISNGSTFNTNTGARTINIAGNWNNNLGGSFVENTSTVVFNGSTNNQTLNPPAGALGETFYDLTINNTFAGGSVTATGNVTITNTRNLRMTSGIFDVGANTLSQASGSANLIATGGDLRLAKLSTILPEFTGTYNITGGTITFNGSAAQTIRSLNTVPNNYHNIVLAGPGIKTLAGNITVRANWTNTGSTLAGNFTVTFAGAGTQTITNTAGESFYSVTVNTTGPLTIEGSSSVTITNTLTMTTGNINLNGRTLTLGNGAASFLTRTSGTAYGGVFRRYWPVGTIDLAGPSRYGLFPVGTDIYYRPVEIVATTNPTTAGYVSVQHIDATTATDVAYTDNEGDAIQRITDMRSVISTTTLAGGIYSLNVTMSALSASGATTDLKLETLAGPPYGVGTSLATGGTTTSPIGRRTLLTVANLNNTFVIGTRNKSTTPLVATYYSRLSGRWTIVADQTWSLTDGGDPCGCTPIASSIVYINPGHTVTVDGSATADFINILNGATLNGTANLTVNYDLTTFGTGRIAPTSGTWSITRNLTVAGTSASSSAAPLTIGGNLTINAANTLTMSNTISLAGNLTVHGTLAMGTNGLTLNGSGTTISGNLGASTITGSGTITITNNKTITTGSNLTVGPVININPATLVTNQGTITHLNNLTGVNSASSVWGNAANAVLNTTGDVLTTGTLLASSSPNTVNYNGSGAQIVKGTTYNNLFISNAGIKTAGAAVTVNNNLLVQDNAQFAPGQNVTISAGGVLTIQDNAIFNQSTNTLTGTNADLVMTDNSEYRIGRTANGTYPELTGNYSLTGGTVVFNQAGNNIQYSIRAVDYYNLNLAATSTGANSYFDFEDGVYIENNLTATLGGASRIRTINGALTVNNDFVFNSSSTGTSTLSNDVTVGTFTLTAGILTVGAFTLEINQPGGWTRNGGTLTLNVNTNVLFSGSDDQVIGGTVSTTFTRLEINNSGSTGVILNQPITVNGVFTLTQGNLVTTNANLLTMAAGSSVSGASNDSFVEGPVAKAGNTNFTFPVGKDGYYRPIGISSLSAVGTFRAEYFHNDPNGAGYNTSLKDVSLFRVNTGEYWLLDRTAGTPNAFVTLSWDDYSGTIANLATLAVARWNGSSWNNLGNGATTGGVSPATGTVRTLGLVSSFSPFTISSLDDTNPLPVELESFTAQLKQGVVLLDWVTASELNNNFFTIERSKDGQLYSELARVEGSGTTHQRTTYSAVDRTPLKGVSYYRLKQTDFDGSFKYVGIVAINNTANDAAALSVFPNPSLGKEVVMSATGFDKAEILLFTLTDTFGKQVYTVTAFTDDAGMATQLLPASTLARGIYIVTLRSARAIISKRLVID